MARNDWYDDPSIVNEPWCVVCEANSSSSCICIEVDGEIIVPTEKTEENQECNHTLSTIVRILEAGLNCPKCGETASSEIRTSATSDTMSVNECIHLKGGEIHEWERNVWVWFTYCPMCGVKL